MNTDGQLYVWVCAWFDNEDGGSGTCSVHASLEGAELSAHEHLATLRDNLEDSRIRLVRTEFEEARTVEFEFYMPEGDDPFETHTITQQRVAS